MIRKGQLRMTSKLRPAQQFYSLQRNQCRCSGRIVRVFLILCDEDLA